MATQNRVSSDSESDLIFTLKRNADAVLFVEDDENGNSEEVEDVKICCVIWKNGKIGAAYYNLKEKLLYVYEELIDLEPHFFLTHSLYREIEPKYVLTVGSKNDEYVKTLINIITHVDDDTTTTTTDNTIRSLPPNLMLVSSKEMSFDVCKNILSNVTLAWNGEESETEKQLHISTLINFDYKMSVYAAGALIKYIDKNWAQFSSNKEDLQFLHIEQITMKNNVLMDWNTLNALQIFQQRSHDAKFKRGLQGSTQEGLSVFRVFSTNCKSKIGLACLKRILLSPVKNIEELTKRLDFITFALNPAHQEFIESLQDNIKNLLDVHTILFKIQNSKAKGRDWKGLYKSIYHAVFINELSNPYAEKLQVLRELRDSISNELIGLEDSINNAIDFSGALSQGRPIIKFGLDQNLDAKKLKRDDIAKHVTAAAKIAVDQLPNFLDECSIVHLPEMGHLICIKEWEPDCDAEILSDYGFQFMFKLRGNIHYKNPLCLELDQSLGDINAEIIAHENRIVQRLASFVIKYNKYIRAPLKILGFIDALIAMAKVAAQNNYIRPNLNYDNIHEIQECRHPLVELVSQCEVNDYYSGGDNYSHIKVITGPNGSGKTIYLKQIALVIYLAHIGSFIPAKQANIGMMFSIHSRMQATESASVRLSGFMIDITQTTQAIHNCKPNSFVLLDEFGRGTLEDEGLSLLLGALRYFYFKGNFCPHILVSTHFQNFSEYLPEGPLVQYMRMSHSYENGLLLYLYKVENGLSTSLAIDIGEEIGLNPDVISRARQFLSNNALESGPDDRFHQYQIPSRDEHEMLDVLTTSFVPELNNKLMFN